ncbi:MAG: hypothetical protein M0D55_02935 [Elusimicrobiota bacterium]|nr:MAG: hypothetical protein M0D55_02935 [Elusimicrobiota bacterium]
MRLTLYWTLAFAAGLWATNAAMYFQRMSLSPASVQAYYLGAAEEYSQPRSAASLLEVSHAHLATMGVMVLLLTHLAIFAPWQDRTKKWVIGLGFGSSFIGEASGWLVRFVSPSFAVLKIACFLTFQGVLALLIAVLAMFLYKAGARRR